MAIWDIPRLNKDKLKAGARLKAGSRGKGQKTLNPESAFNFVPCILSLVSALPLSLSVLRFTQKHGDFFPVMVELFSNQFIADAFNIQT